MNEEPIPFNIITKPIGAICNLDCEYCFYLKKQRLYPESHNFKMTDEVLENYIQQYLDQPSNQITFTWQGGEPTLMGLDFYEKVIRIQEKFNIGNKKIYNTLQTNGVRLDDDWALFFKEHNFLVGVSIDGPEQYHNKLRFFKSGKDSFDSVMRGINYLKKYEVDYNIICCLNRFNADYPFELYDFFMEESGTNYWQFIPIVERKLGTNDMTDYSVQPGQFGRFLVNIFNRWIRNDVGQISIQIFDVAFRVFMGLNPGLCIFEETCGNNLAIEHNGDLFSCDHYVETDYLLGNIKRDDMMDMVCSDKQMIFGENKKASLPEYCRKCDVRQLCNGGCPKNRFVQTPEGETGLNYLCAGYKKLFSYIKPYMKFLSMNYQRNVPLDEITAYIKQYPDEFMDHYPHRNELCFCGSGKKFKKCCMIN